jgi:uncharacterized protein YndB with AHSA1/START domain
MKKNQDTPGFRSIESDIEIAAPVHIVWKALTDAEELSRWFPIEARVTPGVGGSIWGSFGESYEGEASIEVWEPNRQLRIVYPAADSNPESFSAESGGGAPVLMATDYLLEGKAGSTVLRLVHSGFGAGSDWDDLFEATRLGWRFQLLGLRYYLERHCGTPRVVVQMQLRLGDLTLDEAWERLTGSGGFVGLGGSSDAGRCYEIVTASGDTLRGTLLDLVSGRGLTTIVENLGDALLRLWLDPPLYPGGCNMLYVWLSTYGLPSGELEALRGRWTVMLDSLFPPAKH